MKTINRNLIGLEDMNLGVGTFTRSTSTGGTQTLNQVNLPAIPTVIWVDGVIFPTVQAAINALPSSGAGTVLVPPGRWVGPTNIPSGTTIIGMGSNPVVDVTSQTVFLTYNSSLTLLNTIGVRLENLYLDFSSATTPGGVGVILQAFTNTGNAYCTKNIFRNVVLYQAGGSTQPSLQLVSSGTGNFVGNSFNVFEHVAIYGNIATSGTNQGPSICGLKLAGTGTGFSGPAVTLNQFNDVFIRGGLVGCIDIEAQCDTNFFYQIAPLQEWGSTPSNSYILGFNLSDSSAEIDANSCFFSGVSADSGFTNAVRAGQATGHIIDIEGFGSPLSVAVVGGTPQFCGRMFNLNAGSSYNYSQLGSVFSIIGTPTTVVCQGTGNNTNYTNNTTSFTAVDNTNLTGTFVVPLGWKLICMASGTQQVDTASAVVYSRLQDTTAAKTVAFALLKPATSSPMGVSMMGVITGDGNSHTVRWEFATTSTSDTTEISNSNVGPGASIIFILTPSN